MQDFEKLGAFYLGKSYDLNAGKLRDDLLLYDAKDLCTHAVCVGMTGSGKTGLCLSLLEEAAIDGIPAIAIDPKGDLGNLLLTFPKLRPGDFRPWVDPAEATRQGLSADELATQTAANWKRGLGQWGQDGERIARFRNAVDLGIYTPGSSAGIPISLLRSLSAPAAAVLANADALRERITAAASGLLALLSISADPITSREHILISNLLDRAWQAGRDLDLGTLIREIQSPGIDKLGFLELESFYPAKERFELAMRLNNLAASPGFSAWMEGEPLDINRLLYTADGRPRLSILSIAHLSEAERMFFVTLLLGEMVAWMRSQPGTSSLRAMLYMDEVFGYFPPTANPPSKQPMLTLLKQARAYGLGVMLATQNPVDLDYKGLSNTGTWFLGRLQTERDKARVLEGLEGASATTGARFNRAEMEETLAGLGKRVFLMNNVHDDAPVVFQTRWALSYLRGPLTREQIRTLMQDCAVAMPTAPAGATVAAPVREPVTPELADDSARPVLPPGVKESFLSVAKDVPTGSRLLYRPAVLGTAKLHFVQARSKVDSWQTVHLLLRGAESAKWDAAETLAAAPTLDRSPEEGVDFGTLPGSMARKKTYDELEKSLKTQLYRSQKLSLWKCGDLKEVSEPGETEGEFRVRLTQAAREARDLAVEKLRTKYTSKLASMEERIRKAEQRVEKEQAQATDSMFSAAVSVGSSILGAMFGRKLASRTNVSRAATSARAASRAAKQRADIAHAEETVEALKEQLEELEAEFKSETEDVRSEFAPENLELDPFEIKPRKSDIGIDRVQLVWTPWVVSADGIAEAAW